MLKFNWVHVQSVRNPEKMRAPLFLLIIKNIVFFNRVGFVDKNGQEYPEDVLVDLTGYIVSITK